MAPVCARCVPFHPDRQAFIDHYGARKWQQKGGGNFPVFKGLPYQDGYGLGGIMGNFFRGIIPVVKDVFRRVAKSAGSKLVKTGASALADITQGQNIQTVLKKRGIETLKEVGKAAARDLVNTLGDLVQQQNSHDEENKENVPPSHHHHHYQAANTATDDDEDDGPVAPPVRKKRKKKRIAGATASRRRPPTGKKTFF